ncbi:NAD(P)/FAD-dependent oxidoreductase [Mycobacterium aquaticum]|uniref:NADH:ubiquinone reductase (non-electrogenic) n=1 Tax=Mycobacterium aquaticum TaxID=1927124 RepID=A0A1X0B261_9MYCO|nr:NAD(P)/FAD-dependent oxidoreductase [Mycobacterium aquaticum]ORA36414.1 FAD-dependent oxidoreductase [Mycobacterium aquaticum]
MTTVAKRHQVVIIGSGFGGLKAARSLKHADVDVTLISRTTTHLFQPLLYQVATGILSEGEIAPTTRLVLRDQKNVRVRLGEVEGIDLQAKTVTSKLMSQETVTPYDSLIVAAGAQQSYFGNDHFATFAPGMKTIDDALELRGRILGAFEAAEVVTDHAERERRLTFVVVGAGPTGVELPGQIAELAERTLAGAFRSIRPEDCRVILLDAAPAVLPPMGRKLGLKAQKRLERLGVEIQLNAMVTNVDYMGITVKDKDGGERRIDCACKVWSAGVQASPLGKLIAEQSDGSQIDRAGRVIVEPDLTVKGHPYVFVVGDLMAVPDVPGMAQGAIQGAAYATDIIKRSLEGLDDPANREPFKYWDKGSMATVSRFDAVAQVPIPKSSRKLEFGGPLAWLAWLVLHLVYLVGYKNRLTTLVTWFITFLGRGRGQMAITSQMIYARTAMQALQSRQGPLAAVEAADKVEKEESA